MSDKTGTLTQNGIFIIFIILCAMFVYGKLPEMDYAEMNIVSINDSKNECHGVEVEGADEESNCWDHM